MTVRAACVVGSGAREHALAMTLARASDVIVTPGNPGIAGRSPEGHSITSTTAAPEGIDADLFVIGPEAPLVAGLADRLRAGGRLVFGPGADGARLEGSKEFMKQVLADAGVPTARWTSTADLDEAVAFLRGLPGPFVVKTDGLAAGKGVLVTDDLAEAEADAKAKLSGVAFGAAGDRVVIEEGMAGPELSLLVVCDGRTAVPLAPAQDFKRIGDGDTGSNTGGMGAYSPVPLADASLVADVMDRIVHPTLARLTELGIDYRGILYAGLMVTADGPKVIEYNVRFGDPETQVVVPRLETDLFEMLCSAAAGSLGGPITFQDDAAVCVVCASPGYPAEPRTGGIVEGLDAAATVDGVTVFHAGTSLDARGKLVTSGGRVLAVTGRGADVAEARARAYEAVGHVHFEGMQVRSDIASEPARASGGEAA